MATVNTYLAPDQKPESGETVTVKLVRSLGLGKSTCATDPPSNSAISIEITHQVPIGNTKGDEFKQVRRVSFLPF